MDLTAIHQLLVMTHYQDDYGTNELSFQEWTQQMRDMLETRKHGDLAFRDKDFKTAIDCYSQMAEGKGWPMKVKHEFHEHDLELIQRLSYTCDGCEEGGKDWSFYCKDCDFDLHPKCALEENKASKGDNEGGLEAGATTKGWPKKVKHGLHEHELELILRLVDYICDGCEERGKGWSFYCKYCDFGLHRKCALEQNKATKGDKEDGLEEGATTKEGWVCN